MNVLRWFSAIVLLVAGAGTAQASDGDDARSLRGLIEEALKRNDGTTVQAPASASEPVRRWVTDHADVLANLRRSELAEQPWGLTASDGSRVYLYVFDWHTSGQLVVYGMTGGFTRAYLSGDAGREPLLSKRIASSMVFTVPKDPPDTPATVVVLEFSTRLDTVDLAARPVAGDRIPLHSMYAVVHGRTLRYESQGTKNTLGYWTKETDWASWTFEVERPGAYAVEILQGCGKGNGGSEVEFAVDKQVLPVTVEDTGGFQNFKSRTIGRYTFDKPGRYTLTVKPTKKAAKAVMDLRSVTLSRETRGR